MKKPHGQADFSGRPDVVSRASQPAKAAMARQVLHRLIQFWALPTPTPCAHQMVFLTCRHRAALREMFSHN